MKTCPSCGSTDMIQNVRAVDKGDYSVALDMELTTYGNPDALIFKDTRRSKLSAVVCSNCGLVFFYAQDPQLLKVEKGFK
jgi:predicted nucleic-acid-binding Zn-ribbon protein